MEAAEAAGVNPAPAPDARPTPDVPPKKPVLITRIAYPESNAQVARPTPPKLPDIPVPTETDLNDADDFFLPIYHRVGSEDGRGWPNQMVMSLVRVLAHERRELARLRAEVGRLREAGDFLAAAAPCKHDCGAYVDGKPEPCSVCDARKAWDAAKSGGAAC